MQRKLIKILSSLLILALLLSSFAIFSFAAETDAGAEESTLRLLVHRSYDEGWDVANGVGYNKKVQEIYIDHEQTVDYNYNYFTRFEVASDVSQGFDGHIQYDFGSTPLSGHGVLEFDVKADSTADFGSIAYFLTDAAAAKRDYVNMYRIVNNELYLELGGAKTKIADLRGQWVHIASVFTFDQNVRGCSKCKSVFGKGESCPNACEGRAENCVITMRTYFGETAIYDFESAVNYDEVTDPNTAKNTYYRDTVWVISRDYMPATIATIRMGFPDYRANNVGASYCIDNFTLYYDSANPTDEEGNKLQATPVKDIHDVDKYGYGARVNKNATKVITILGNVESRDYLSTAVIMKVGSNYMLKGKENRQAIFVNSETGKPYGAPRKIDGLVYVPFEAILNATGYPVYVHDDGISYDISTAGGTSLLTIDRRTAVVNGERVELAAPPRIIADPDDASNTYPAITINDVEKFFQGYYMTYDEMGLIIISEGKNVLNREQDLSMMLNLVNTMIYEYSSEEELLAMMEENTNGFDHPYLIVTDEKIDYMRKVYSGEIEDAFYKSYLDKYVTHIDNNHMIKYTTLPGKPANPTYEVYAYERDPDKYQMLAFELTNPFSGIKNGEVWTDNANYTYVKAPDENGHYYPSKLGDRDNGPNYNDGYDWAGGRNSEGVSYAQQILDLATAYLITGDMDYATLAYDMTISLCDEDNWHNWSHKHFLSVGEMMMRLGLAYDWLYDAWAEIQNTRAEEYDLAHITQTIYRRAYFHSYETSRYGKTREVWTRDTASYINGTSNSVWNWSVVEINWNCVCNCGLVIGAMAIVGEEDPKIDYSFVDDGVNAVEWTLRNNFWRIAEFGLVQYAPDGSYIESPGYWSYATNYLTYMLAALPGVFGDDLGFFETAGLDRTYYFAVQAEYAVKSRTGTTYNMWYYNDCGFGGQQDTQAFFFAADFLNDPALAAIRIDGLATGSKGLCSWVDIVGYKPEFSGLSMKDVEMELDWELQSLDGVVARSSWDGFPTYVGVMGNHNNKIQHDQVDSGNFIYASQGYSWIIDLGSDDYNIYEYWGNDIRERYYRNSPEGHNTIIVTSLQDPSQDNYMPYGQVITGGGKMVTHYDGGAAGMYAIVDNSGAYGTITNYARRGLLFTNNRTTTVIQDEIAFKGVQSCAWIAHTQGNIMLANGGKTAYITKELYGETKCIRLSLLTDNSRLKFEIMTCGIGEDDFLMDGANRLGYSESMGGVPEKSREGLKRLVIKCDNSLIFNCAVVIENVNKLGDDPVIQYEYKNINKWTVEEKFTPSKPTVDNSESTVTSAKMTDIKTYSSQAAKLIESGYALSTRTVDFFKALVRVTIAVNTYRPESFKNIPQINSAYEQYLGQLKFYDAYKEDINVAVKESRNMGALFTYTA